MSNKKLIIEPGGGLGNRILMLISAFNLAKDCGIDDIVVLWRNNNECGCEYEDVFEMLPLPCRVKGIHFGKESYKTLLSSGKIFVVFRKFFHQFFYDLFRKYARRIQLDIQEGHNNSSDWNNIRHQVEKSKSKLLYIEGYFSFYGDVSCKGFSFNKKINEELDEFLKKSGEYDAMHIRRTDNVMAIKNSPTELFFEKASQIIASDPDRKIYVATDDLAILQDMRSKWPDNIIFSPAESISRNSRRGIQFALYEMLILSRAETIFASFGSTFSQIANLIGGNKMEVLVEKNVYSKG